MQKYSSFTFSASWWKAIKDLPRDIRGEVLTAVIEYGLNGVTTEHPKRITGALLAIIIPQVDALRRSQEEQDAEYIRMCEVKDAYNTLIQELESTTDAAPNDRKAGAPKGSQNNPNGRRGKDKITNQELIKTNSELIRTNSELIPIISSSNKEVPERQVVSENPNSLNALSSIYNNTNKAFNNNLTNNNLKKEEKETNKEREEKNELNFAQIVDLYHSICKSYPRVRRLSEKRKTKIRVRFCKEMNSDLELLTSIFTRMEESKFMQGDNQRGWKADFDWVFSSEDNWVKILEGKYDDRAKAPAPQVAAQRRAQTTRFSNDSIDEYPEGL